MPFSQYSLRNMSLPMDVNIAERRTSGTDAERPVPTGLSGLDLCSLAQELRQAVCDSHAAVESLGVSTEQQGEAAAGVLQRVVHALEQQTTSSGTLICSCWACYGSQPGSKVEKQR